MSARCCGFNLRFSFLIGSAHFAGCHIVTRFAILQRQAGLPRRVLCRGTIYQRDAPVAPRYDRRFQFLSIGIARIQTFVRRHDTTVTAHPAFADAWTITRCLNIRDIPPARMPRKRITTPTTGKFYPRSDLPPPDLLPFFDSSRARGSHLDYVAPRVGVTMNAALQRCRYRSAVTSGELRTNSGNARQAKCCFTRLIQT